MLNFFGSGPKNFGAVTQISSASICNVGGFAVDARYLRWYFGLQVRGILFRRDGEIVGLLIRCKVNCNDPGTQDYVCGSRGGQVPLYVRHFAVF